MALSAILEFIIDPSKIFDELTALLSILELFTALSANFIVVILPSSTLPPLYAVYHYILFKAVLYAIIYPFVYVPFPSMSNF